METPWFQADEGERHRLLVKQIRELDNHQFGLRDRDLAHGYAYDPTVRLMGTEMLVQDQLYDPPIENVIRSGIDTMASYLSRDRPRLAVVTDGGDFEMQEAARGIEKVLEAELRRLSVYRARYIQIRDGGVFGSGWTKLYEDIDANRPALERTLKDELLWDEEEARDYEPRCIYQRRFVDRWMLLHQLRSQIAEKPELKDKILQANADGRWCDYRRMGRHQVALLEGWHLPSGEGATDGRRTMCIEGADLVDVPWKRPYFPFLKWDWSPRLVGYCGSGIAEQGLPVQERIDRHDRFIAVAQDKVAIPRVYVQKGSGVGVRLDNRVGAIVEVPGRPPTFETPQAVSPEIYNDREAKRRLFFEAMGISQTMAQAKRQPGLDSRPAQREYRDQTTERHAVQDQDAEDLLVMYGERTLDIIEDIHARTGEYKTVYLADDTREEVDWDEVKMGRERFSLVVTAANGLSRTIAAKRQEAEEDYASGVISKDEYRKVRGIPDISAERNIESATIQLADAIISGLIKGRPFSEIGPEGGDDLEFIIRRVTLKRALLKAHRAKPALLERFDQWLEQAEYLTEQGKQAQAAAQQPAVPAQVQAGVPPGPAMVPNAPPAAQMPVAGAM